MNKEFKNIEEYVERYRKKVRIYNILRNVKKNIISNSTLHFFILIPKRWRKIFENVDRRSSLDNPIIAISINICNNKSD